MFGQIRGDLGSAVLYFEGTEKDGGVSYSFKVVNKTSGQTLMEIQNIIRDELDKLAVGITKLLDFFEG